LPAPFRLSPGSLSSSALEAGSGWERHPFTISSAPQEPLLRISIKELGEYTQRLVRNLRAGVPARVGIAFGMFDYRRGGRKQVWVGWKALGSLHFGVGYARFPAARPREFDIDLFYMVRSEDDALFLDEMGKAAAHNRRSAPTSRTRRARVPLTLEQIATTCDGPVVGKGDLHVRSEQLGSRFRSRIPSPWCPCLTHPLRALQLPLGVPTGSDDGVGSEWLTLGRLRDVDAIPMDFIALGVVVIPTICRRKHSKSNSAGLTPVDWSG